VEYELVSSNERDLITNPEGAGRAAPARDAATILVPGLARRIEVKAAATRDEFEQAFRLLACKYQARGYEQPSPKLFRFTPYHVLPETTTFVAKHGAEVVATLSLVPDTALLGLPLECIYGPEIAHLRREGRRLGEVTSLADRDLGPREFFRVFTALMRLVAHDHLHRGGDSWVITVHPRHCAYYRKMLGFVSLGPRRSYPSVQDHPAEAFLIDAGLMRANAPAMYREIFGTPLPEAVLTVPERPGDHSRYFADHSTQADRRTILDLLHRVEHLGSAPRWGEEVERIAA
jgi:hypothetical protein